MTISKTILAVLVTGMLSVLGSAVMAFVDVQVMKRDLDHYRQAIVNLETHMRDLRKETNEGFREIREAINKKDK